MIRILYFIWNLFPRKCSTCKRYFIRKKMNKGTVMRVEGNQWVPNYRIYFCDECIEVHRDIDFKSDFYEEGEE